MSETDSETITDDEVLVETVGFEADPTESPLSNLRRLVDLAPPGVPRRTFLDACLRSIPGYGGRAAERGYDRIVDERDDDSPR